MWRLWKKTVCNIFAGLTHSTKLNHPLGIWRQSYQDVRRWSWHLSPIGSLLYQDPVAPGTHVAILMHLKWTQLIFSLTVPTNQAFTGPPITLIDKYQKIVALPVPGLEYVPLPTLPYQQHKNLIEQF